MKSKNSIHQVWSRSYVFLLKLDWKEKTSETTWFHKSLEYLKKSSHTKLFEQQNRIVIIRNLLENFHFPLSANHHRIKNNWKYFLCIFRLSTILDFMQQQISVRIFLNFPSFSLLTIVSFAEFIVVQSLRLDLTFAICREIKSVIKKWVEVGKS